MRMIGDMKMRHIFIFLFFISVTNLFSESIKDTFNYYVRHFDGSYELDSISNEELKMPLFSYQYLKDADHEYIKGLYYGSDKVKFIDTVQNNKIYRTVYYDFFTNEILFEKRYTYSEEGSLTFMEIDSVTTEDKKGKAYARFSFIKDEQGTFNYTAYRLAEYGSITGTYAYSEGKFDKDFRPLTIYSTIIKKHKLDTGVIKAIEKYQYDEAGTVYDIYIDGSKFPVYKRTDLILDNGTCTNITMYFDNGIWESSYLLKNLSETEIEIYSDVLQNSIEKENIKTPIKGNVRILKVQNLLQRYDSELICEDEKVYLKDDKPVESLLTIFNDIYTDEFRLSHALFSDRIYFSRAFKNN